MSEKPNGNDNEIKNEVEKLKQELKEMKEMMAETKAAMKRDARHKKAETKAKSKERFKARAKARSRSHRPRPPRTPPDMPNFGKVIHTYVSGVMDSVATGIEEAVSTIDIELGKGSKKKKKYRASAGSVASEFLPDFFKTAADFLSILSDENRLKLLKKLERGGKYQKGLSEETGIKGGTFKHHIDKLIEANYVTQEVVRGRYLITMEGREALKLAEFLYLKKYPSHSSSAVQYEEEAYEEEDDFDEESYQVEIEDDFEEKYEDEQ